MAGDFLCYKNTRKEVRYLKTLARRIMMSNVEDPRFEKESFVCPRCGVNSQQHWTWHGYEIYPHGYEQSSEKLISSRNAKPVKNCRSGKEEG